MFDIDALHDNGRQPCFQQQLGFEQWDSVVPVRVAEIQRSQVQVWLNHQILVLPVLPGWSDLAVQIWGRIIEKTPISLKATSNHYGKGTETPTAQEANVNCD